LTDPRISFRNRIILTSALAAEEGVTERIISSEGNVVLYGPGQGESIHNAREVRVYGWDYPTPNEALEAGRRWRSHLLIAFAHFGIGSELGPEDETAVIPQFAFGDPYFSNNAARRMRDIPKLLIFPTNREPQWGGLAAEASVLWSLDSFINGPIEWVLTHPYPALNMQQRLAYGLFHASQFEQNPEAAYILLVTAVEALLPTRQHNQQVVPIVEALQRALADEMPQWAQDLRERVSRSLDEIKFDSVGRRIRALAKALRPQRFRGEKPDYYVTRIYDVRSDLVHGNLDRLNDDELYEQLPELRQFVLALLDENIFHEPMPTVWA
jgi:hypothetical protein